MIAAQYSFVLPADYDMDIIEARIRDKGPMLDGFPHLGFKAYLSARRQDSAFESAVNLYAPFYLWREPVGMSNFLTSPGFAGLCRDFGRPSIDTWIVWHAELSPAFAEARYASRRIEPIAPSTGLAGLHDATGTEARDAVAEGALAAVAGFEPTTWRLVRFELWRDVPEVTEAAQVYKVGHVSR